MLNPTSCKPLLLHILRITYWNSDSKLHSGTHKNAHDAIATNEARQVTWKCISLTTTTHHVAASSLRVIQCGWPEMLILSNQVCTNTNSVKRFAYRINVMLFFSGKNSVLFKGTDNRFFCGVYALYTKCKGIPWNTLNRSGVPNSALERLKAEFLGILGLRYQNKCPQPWQWSAQQHTYNCAWDEKSCFKTYPQLKQL